MVHLIKELNTTSFEVPLFLLKAFAYIVLQECFTSHILGYKIIIMKKYLG